MKRYVIKILLLTNVLLFALFSKAQQNLVPNPSFETYTACPDGCQFDYLTNWVNPTGYTPDFYNVCVSNTLCGVPFNSCGYQFAASGGGYCGIITGAIGAPFPGIREYIQVKLTNTLTSNVIYTFSMKISIPDSVKLIANSVGAFFSSNAISSNDNYVLPVTPQLNFNSLNHNTSKVSWTTLTNTFVATGGEQYLTIGNFNNDNLTSIDTYTNTGDYLGGFSILYIDDIWLTDFTNSIKENSLDNYKYPLVIYEQKEVEISSNEKINGVKITSYFGEVCYNSKLETNTVKIDLKNYSDGFYLLEILTDNFRYIKRIIIN